MLDEEKFITILKEELIPALGCTEPIAFAYAAAKCRQVLGNVAESIEVSCSGNLIKNVMGVVVPNCGGLKGIDAAVVAGMLFGDFSAGLEVLSTIQMENLVTVKEFLARKLVRTELLETSEKLHLIVKMHVGDHSALVEILDRHTNIVRIEKDNRLLFSAPVGAGGIKGVYTDRACLSVKKIVAFSEKVNLMKIYPIIEPQIENNWRICSEGLENIWGAEVGRTILETQAGGALCRVEALAAAGSDARMSGCSLPVVINSGSGNQGITVSVPVVEYARSHKIPDEKLIRALAISNLLAIHQKARIGRLSAYCGVVCAACGAGAAITWLAGGSLKQIDETIVNTLATISGMMCDGAKPSCAGKIAVAVHAAYLAHEMAMSNRSYCDGDGIVKSDVERTVSNIGTIASEGMKDTDKVILSVMLQN